MIVYADHLPWFTIMHNLRKALEQTYIIYITQLLQRTGRREIKRKEN